MAKDPIFRCSVITPEAAVLEAEVTSVVFPAHDGQIGVLRDRAPLLCKLGIGELRADTLDGLRRYFIDGGFAQVFENRVTVLTKRALPADAITPDVVQKAEEVLATHVGHEPDTLAERERAQRRLIVLRSLQHAP